MSSVPSALAGARYLKMNGAGNEIVVLDLRGTRHRVTAAEARAIAAAPGSAYDQLMVIHDPKGPQTDASMLIYNNDGSEAGACGNGTRCVGWALTADEVMGGMSDEVLVESRAGLLSIRRTGETEFLADMGVPKLEWHQIPLAEEFRDTRAIELQVGPIDAPILHSPAVVNMGNPHAIFFVDDPYAYDLERFGPLLENHPIFPERANISLAAVTAPDRIVLRVWERGAGITRACGSAACATLVAAARKKLTGRAATICLPGGELHIAWREGDDHVLMTGPVEFEHEGHFAPETFKGAA